MFDFHHPYAYFYDFLEGAYVQHTNWNTRTQTKKQIILTPETLPITSIYPWNLSESPLEYAPYFFHYE